MPWNDNANPGPWGAPPPGNDGGKPGSEPPRREEPRRRPPPPPSGGGGPTAPDLNELSKRIAERARAVFCGPGGKGVRPVALWAILSVAALGWMFTGVYTVQANQEAVITRFGGYARSVGPGLHYHLPIPIEKAELVSVTNQNKTVVGGADLRTRA